MPGIESGVNVFLSVKQLDRICILTVLVVFFTGGGFVVHSGISERKRISSENGQIASRLRDLSTAEEEIRKVDSALVQRKENLRFLNEKIPESLEIGWFLKEVNTIMKEKEITLMSLQPLQAVKERLFTRLPVRMVFRGPFGRVYDMIHDLETMKQAVVVEKLVIQRGGGSSQECQVDLSASIFRR
jgi:Tfp pilus assembly protein PilO